ncbi:BCCT family transporter [Salisediminibacterium halotolerans]|uniref:BCCT family transporter n=1 Tax=Salisediminibacterium halotolerans TaxID=517425 RepID=UPI000EB4C169|nr:BCCT family transporter [Salisediminibacterium halotolerans]RLJ69702.1 glycine betaine transporter [Actinophytocola xinjiangensis]RPE89760.1 glycine betaine transporter [Salisediminibacterium halotolerans]TWG32596.1 glycine betaine transporter [Salisediminibacterium halotolerans]GEL08971.1 glycine/betaine ABC transporter permease [Salisediminibacterium halotolerans]
MRERRRGLQTFSQAMKTPVFIISLVIAVSFVIMGVFLPNFEPYIEGIFAWVTEYLGWSLILGAGVFVLVTIYLIFSPLGEIKLGEDGESPAYSTTSWFAMLFSAGMGIGLLFWGVSEPINHYDWPKFAEPQSSAAIHEALQFSLFHWGFHPWAIYAIVAASLAYFTYRKGLPMLLSSTLEPILGRDGIDGKIGSTVNIIGVISTLFGISTSLGFGVMQIGGGFEALFGIPNSTGLWLTIIFVVTLMAIISTTTGIDRGIKWLSQANLGVAGSLMIFVLILGPTLFILDALTHSTGQYLQNFFSMSFGIDAAGEGQEGWYDAWTIFYWAWWISWAPFVGSFIARVSRGRTIRSFAIGVMLAPTAASIVWFSIFGGAALFNEHYTDTSIIDAVMQDEAAGFFALLESFPLTNLLVVIAMLSLTVFFVTSSDSGTYVLGMLTSKGNMFPPMKLRITWGVLEGAFAAVLLMAGGLSALQTSAVLGGFPFMIIMFFMIYSLIYALNKELREGSLPYERSRIYAALADLQKEDRFSEEIIEEEDLEDAYNIYENEATEVIDEVHLDDEEEADAEEDTENEKDK